MALQDAFGSMFSAWRLFAAQTGALSVLYCRKKPGICQVLPQRVRFTNSILMPDLQGILAEPLTNPFLQLMSQQPLDWNDSDISFPKIWTDAFKSALIGHFLLIDNFSGRLSQAVAERCSWLLKIIRSRLYRIAHGAQHEVTAVFAYSRWSEF